MVLFLVTGNPSRRIVHMFIIEQSPCTCFLFLFLFQVTHFFAGAKGIRHVMITDERKGDRVERVLISNITPPHEYPPPQETESLRDSRTHDVRRAKLHDLKISVKDHLINGQLKCRSKASAIFSTDSTSACRQFCIRQKAQNMKCSRYESMEYSKIGVTMIFKIDTMNEKSERSSQQS